MENAKYSTKHKVLAPPPVPRIIRNCLRNQQLKSFSRTKYVRDKNESLPMVTKKKMPVQRRAKTIRGNLSHGKKIKTWKEISNPVNETAAPLF